MTLIIAMSIKYNKQLYYKYFKLWIYSVIISFTLCMILLLLNRMQSIDISPSLIVGVLLLPLVIVSIYGILKNYTITYTAGYIREGITSKYINFILLVLYFILVAVVG